MKEREGNEKVRVQGKRERDAREKGRERRKFGIKGKEKERRKEKRRKERMNEGKKRKKERKDRRGKGGWPSAMAGGRRRLPEVAGKGGQSSKSKPIVGCKCS